MFSICDIEKKAVVLTQYLLEVRFKNDNNKLIYGYTARKEEERERKMGCEIKASKQKINCLPDLKMFSAVERSDDLHIWNSEKLFLLYSIE